MRTSTSLRASTSMAVHPSIGSTIMPQPIAKYAKIQPAIAIKPKPSAAVAVTKPAFNPRYDPTTSSALLHDGANINTLRKWVLPPRPRPGRKPSAPLTTTPVTERATKKKAKVQKRPEFEPAAEPIEEPRIAGLSGQNGIAQASGIGQAGFSGDPETLIASRPPPARKAEPLQASYLARLKEQELIRNYIDVLTDQIKELRFVQSGVITFDALNDSTVPRTLQQSEQLDHINNIHDLDKFLAHMTTQSNVIHSVTKKFVDDQNQGSHMHLQILHYLELRAKHRGAVSTERPLSFLPKVAQAAPAPSFTPSLLRPLNLNLFDAEEDVIDVDFNYDDQLDQLRFEKEADSLLNLEPEKPVEKKKKLKMGCGFCSGDTPCLCFDADSIFGER